MVILSYKTDLVQRDKGDMVCVSKAAVCCGVEMLWRGKSHSLQEGKLV